MYFIDTHHPNNFFNREKIYNEPDDFDRFTYFSRAALEFLLQFGKRPNIIHCHDWPVAMVVGTSYILLYITCLRVCPCLSGFSSHVISAKGQGKGVELGWWTMSRNWRGKLDNHHPLIPVCMEFPFLNQMYDQECSDVIKFHSVACAGTLLQKHLC